MSQESKPRDPRSSLLWNVVDPDDPYDIRKSMIARLPDHTQNFMGGNLQIVCLMQAAQVQRLNIYLSQFKLKYRELQRRQLDRHAYQVLIKQLTEKANDSSKLRIDNQKLREYIKKLSEQLDRRPNVSASLQSQHQQLLKKYQSLLSQLQISRQSLQANNITIIKLTEQNKQLRIKYDRLDKQRLTELTQQREKYELKIRERIQIQIKQVEHRFNGRIYQLQSDCKLYRQQIQSKNHQITSLMSRIQLLKRQLQQKQRQKSNIKWQDKARQLQSINQNLAKKASQLQRIFQQYSRLQIQLKDVQRSFERSEQQNRFYKSQIQRLSQFADKSKENQIIQELENKIALLSLQVERLTFMNGKKNQEVAEANDRYNALKQQYERKSKQITEQYEIRLSKVQKSQMALQTLESQIRRLRVSNEDLKAKNDNLTKQVSMSTSMNSRRLFQLEDQINKLHSTINVKNQQIYNLQAKIKSNQIIITEVYTLRKTLADKQRIFESVNAQRANYEMRLRNLTKQLESKDQLRKQLQREVTNNHQLRNHAQTYRITLTQNEQLIQRLRIQINDVKKLVEQYQFDIKNGTLIPRNAFQKSNSQLLQQNKLLKEEIHQLNQALMRKDRQGTQTVSTVEIRFTNQLTQMANSLKMVREQNERLILDKNRLKGALSDAEKQVITKQKQYIQSLRQANRKIDQLGAVNQELRRQNTRVRHQISISQQSILRIQKQTEERSISIYNSQLQDKDNIIATLERQIKAAREQLKALQTTYENSNVTMKSYRERLLMASQQIQRLTDLHKKRNEQAQAMKNQLNYTQQYKKQLLQKDNVINQYKIQINYIEQYKRQLSQKDITINQLKGQLNYVQQYKKQLLQKDNIITQKDNIINQLKGQLSSNQQYKRELVQKDNLINQLKNQLNYIQQYKKQLAHKDTIITQLKGNANYAEEYKKQLANKETIINQLKNQLDGYDNNFKNQLRQRDQIIRNLKIQIQNSQANFRQKIIEERQLIIRQIKSQYELKIQTITESQNKSIGLQNDKLSKVIQNLKNQTNIYKVELQKRNAVIKQIQTQLFALRSQKQNHLQMISQLQISITKMQNNVRTNNQQIQRKCYQQQIEIKNLKQIIEQLEDINNHTTAERDHLFEVSHQYKQQIANLQKVVTQMNGKQSSFNQIRTKYNELTVLCQRYQQQIKTYQLNIETVSQKNRQYEAKLRQMISEMDRLTLILKQRESNIGAANDLREQIKNLTIQLSNRTEQAKQWEQKYVQLYQAYKNESEVSRSKILEYQRKIGTLDEQFEQLNLYIQTMKEQNQELRRKLSTSTQFSQKIKLLTIQIENLNKFIVTLKQENQQLKNGLSQYNDLIQKNKFLSAEIDRLNILIQQLKTDLSDTRLRLIDQMALQKRIEQHMALFVVLFAEIETLRSRVLQTEKQCENVRRSSIAPHRVDRQVGRSLQPRMTR